MVVEMLVRGLIGLAAFAVLYTAARLIMRKGSAAHDAQDIGLD